MQARLEIKISSTTQNRVPFEEASRSLTKRESRRSTLTMELTSKTNLKTRSSILSLTTSGRLERARSGSASTRLRFQMSKTF